MNPRTMRILGAVALLALVLAWWLNRPAADPAAGGKSDGFLPGYHEKINQVTRLELDDGKEPLRLEKRGAGWVDTGRGGYPVKTEEVKRLLLALNALQKKEAKTDKPELHGQLQLALNGDEETRGKVLRLWTGAAGQPAAGQPSAEKPDWELVIGKAKWTPVRGLYLRLLGENQCWFAAGDLQLPYAPTAWLEKEIVNLNQLDVARVVLVRGAETFTIMRPDGDTPWTLAELPDGRALQENSPFSSLANTLGYLNFDDVAPSADARFARDPDIVAEFVCFNGASIRGTGWKEGDDLWMRFEAAPPTAAAPPAEPVTPPPADPQADPPAAAPKGPAGPSAEQIATWSAAFAGWTYKLSPWKVKGLQQPLEDWLAPLPAAEPAPEGAPEQPPGSEQPPAPGGGNG